MTDHAPTCLRRLAFRRLIGILAAALLLTGLSTGAAESTAFDVPAGDAATTLRVFSEQSGQQVVFMADTVRGEQTKAVRGHLTPRAALESMLAGTRLLAVQDSQTQALAVQRVAAGPAANPTGPVAPAAGRDSTPTGRNAAAAAAAEAVVLSPFVVATQQDTGYIAADTLNAGRLRTNLLMTPGTMEVFTRDLLDDLGVFNIDEASAWLTSSHPLEANGINGNSLNPTSLALHDSGSNVSLRGMATQPSTRNYFLSATTPMEYNVQRVEAGRGPNAILYGEGGPGGGVNYITKQAERRRFGSLRLRTDTAGTRGASLDLNQPLTRSLAVRYNASFLDQRSYIDRFVNKSVGHAASIVWQPVESTRWNFDADVTRTRRPGFVMASFNEQTADWNRVPVTGNLTTAQATAAGLALRAAAGFTAYIEGVGAVDLRSTAATTGSGIPLISSHPAGIALIPSPAESFNVNPEEVSVRGATVDLQTSLDHRFRNGFSVQLAAQQAKYRAEGGNNPFSNAVIDPNVNLPGGSRNPNFGKVYSTSFLGRKIDGTGRDSETIRLVAAYPLKGFGGTTNLSAFGHHQESNSRIVYWDMQNADSRLTTPITDNITRRINIYRYWDNLPSRLPDFSKLFDLRAVPTADGYTANKNDAYEIAASGDYLRGRLTYVAGFRRDRSELTTRNGDTASRDRATGAFGTYTVENRVAFNNTRTFGLVYFPFERLGAYADYSEGFTIQTNANPKMDGTFAGANIVPSKSESAGLRFRIASGNTFTIVGSIGYYQAVQENSAININVGAVNTLWQNHRMPERYLETFSASPTVTAAANSVQSTRSFSGKGYEANLTINIGNSFRLIANGALPQTRQFDTAADFRAYVAANTAQWEQWANDSTNATRTSDANSLRTVQNIVNGFQDEREQNGTYKTRFNLTGVYTLRSGPLKGLRLGAGAQFYGRRLIANQIDRPYDYVYSRSYYLVSASLAYPFKLRHHRLEVQLNADNVLNHDDPMINGMFVYNNTLIPYGFRRMTPPEIKVTTTLKF